jgi:hypothetical protein
MKTKYFLWVTAAFGAMAVAAVAAETNHAAVPFNQIGVAAIKQYSGDGLAVVQDAAGATLRCVFQKLEGRVTREGLWLSSTAGTSNDFPFRVIAESVGSEHGQVTTLQRTGEVQIGSQTALFHRVGLDEEFTVGVDGVRQDFVLPRRPAGHGSLRLELKVDGARPGAAPDGVRLVLSGSGRKLAYNHLRATDANGRQLAARMEVRGKSEIRNQKSEIALVVDDADAVYPVRIDPTFSDANWIGLGGVAGIDGRVNAAGADGAGILYVGGAFTVAGSTLANNIARWNGTDWSALGPGINGVVYALATSGGILYAGGVFTNAGGIAATNIAQWNGSSWSALGSGMGDGYGGSYVYALAVSGGTLYAGGNFTTAGGILASNIAQWDGSSWSALGSGMGGVHPYGPDVYALAVSGGKLFAGGGFTSAGGTSANGIAQWDGSSWSALGSGVGDGYGGDYVYALAVSGGRLYAGGDFQTAGGNSAYFVAEWDGTNWSALGSGIGGDGSSTVVRALAVSGGTLYVGGLFLTAGGLAADSIAQWNGSNWSALGSGLGGGFNVLPYYSTSVSALVVSGGTLYAGGYFSSAGGVAANDVAQWNGSSWSALGSGTGGGDVGPVVCALAVSKGALYAGGSFTTAGGLAANSIAQWNGGSWSALGSGMNRSVNALAVAGSTLYVGGNFSTAGGTNANYIAQWNGSSWSPLGSGMNSSVNALAVSGGTLYAAGDFTMAGGTNANYIAQWNGSSWSPLGSGMNNDVYALTVAGGTLYAGGNFTRAGGTNANYIAQWNGSSWSPLGYGMNNDVYALAVEGGTLYAGGNFTAAGSTNANYIAAWDGTNWSALGSGVGGSSKVVRALGVSGATLYVGGLFTRAGGLAANSIAQWNGGSWSALGSGMNGSVSALAVAGGTLYAGGRFSTAGGKVSAYAADAILNPGDWLTLQTGNPGPRTNTLTYLGLPSSQYVAQYATNLTSSPWFPLATNTPGAYGVGTVLDAAATDPQRFYRLSAP